MEMISSKYSSDSLNSQGEETLRSTDVYKWYFNVTNYMRSHHMKVEVTNCDYPNFSHVKSTYKLGDLRRTRFTLSEVELAQHKLDLPFKRVLFLQRVVGMKAKIQIHHPWDS